MPKPKGLPKTGGRKPGTPNKRTAAVEKAVADAAQKIAEVVPGAFEGDAHALLMSIYKDPAREMPLRIDAAKAAIRFEKPALAAVETGKPGEFSEFADKEALKQRIKARSVTLGLAKVLPIRGDKSAT